MDLKDFIKASIIDIVDALSESQAYIIENGLGEGIESGYKRINFDVAVTSQDENKSGIGGKVSVVSVFSVNGNKQEISTVTNYSRIQFETLIAISPNKVKAGKLHH